MFEYLSYYFSYRLILKFSWLAFFELGFFSSWLLSSIQSSTEMSSGANKKYNTMTTFNEADRRKILESLTADELATFQEAFTVFDKNQDGTITTKELSTVMRSLGQNPTDAEVQDMINEVDVDGSGAIEFPEFCLMLAKKTEECDVENEIRGAFRVFDKERTGGIAVSEMRSILSNLPEKVSNEEIEEMLRTADRDGNGYFTYDEFRMMIGHTISMNTSAATPLGF